MKRTAFTLLELLIVLAILIVIIGIVGTTVWSSYEKALVRSATVQVKTFTDVLETFRMDHNRYPSTREGLELLVGQVNPNANAAQGEQTIDPMTGMPVAGTASGTGTDAAAIDPMTGLPALANNDPTAPVGLDPTADPNAQAGAIDPLTGQPIATNQPAATQAKSYGKYLDTKDVPKDPWGNPYRYEWPTFKGDGKRPAVWSSGPDRNDDQGGNDDVISWDPTAVNPRAAAGGTLPNATIDPLTGQPIGTDSFLAPGDMNMQQGMQQGMMDPNMTQQGMTQPGMMDPNAAQQGMMDPNMAQPGMMPNGGNNQLLQPGGVPNPGVPAQPNP